MNEQEARDQISDAIAINHLMDRITELNDENMKIKQALAQACANCKALSRNAGTYGYIINEKCPDCCIAYAIKKELGL